MRSSVKVLFIHGLESGVNGDKARYLRKHFNLIAPAMLTGSSMGGATVLEAAKRGVVRSPVLLLAPALKKVITLKSSEERRNDIMEAWYAEFNSQVSEAVKKRSVIVHGVLDDVVPIEDSREFSARTGIRLVEVPGGDHRLTDYCLDGHNKKSDGEAAGKSRQDKLRSLILEVCGGVEGNDEEPVAA